MSSNCSVFKPGSSKFQLPLGVLSDEKQIFLNADRLPTVNWPDGRWCVEGNLFLLDLFESGLSRSGRGGSLLTYASQLAHIIKYCYRNQLAFIDMTDSHFHRFVRGLSVSDTYSNVNEKFGKRRTGQTILQIGKTCLHFLKFVGELYGVAGFVSSNGSIKARQKSGLGRGRKGSTQCSNETALWHASFPLTEPLKNRGPISTADIEKLKIASFATSGSNFLLKRRLSMILALEMTGGRRAEVSHLKVVDIENALASGSYELSMKTLKRGGNRLSERCVPVSKSDLIFLKEYIDKNRARVIRKTIGKQSDEGYLFISERAGKKLTADYIGYEVYKLRRAAKIESRQSAHSFRHRYITRIFVQLLKLHQYENAEDFRRALINTSTLKQKVMEWSGHRNVASLERYIDLAFDEFVNFDETLDTLKNMNERESISSQLNTIAHNLLNGTMKGSAAAEYLKRLAATF